MSAQDPNEKIRTNPAKLGEALAKNDNGQKDPNTLTPEEQMARYEDSLKEDDWGHQPC